MAFKLFTTLVTVVAATTTFAQTDLAQCDFVFIPNGDPSDGDIAADFNYVPGFAMLSTGDGGEGFIQGATYTEDPEGVFNVHNAFSKVGWTCAQTADFQESLAGQTLPGATGFLWTIQSAECSCDN